MPTHERRRTAVAVSEPQAPAPPLQSASRRLAVDVPVFRALHSPGRPSYAGSCHFFLDGRSLAAHLSVLLNLPACVTWNAVDRCRSFGGQPCLATYFRRTRYHLCQARFLPYSEERSAGYTFGAVAWSRFAHANISLPTLSRGKTGRNPTTLAEGGLNLFHSLEG